MANVTARKTGDIAAGVWVSSVCRSNLVPSQYIQLPCPEEFGS